MKKPRHSVALKALEPITLDSFPLEPLPNRLSPAKTNAGICGNNFSGSYQKSHKYEMVFTKGHVERTVKQKHIVQDPFKVNAFHFDPYLKDFEMKNYIKKQNKTLKMKVEA